MDTGRVITCPCSFLEAPFPIEPKNRGSYGYSRGMRIKTPAGRPWPSWLAKTTGSKSSARNGRLTSHRANSPFFPKVFHLVMIQADYLEGDFKSGWLTLGLT